MSELKSKLRKIFFSIFEPSPSFLISFAKVRRFSQHLPIIAGLVILVTTIILWQALLTKEYQIVEQNTNTVIKSLKSQITAETQKKIVAAVELASRFQAPKTQPEEIYQEAKILVDHLGGYEAIALVSRDGKVEFITPEIDLAAKNILDRHIQKWLSIALETSLQQDYLTFTNALEWSNNRKAFLAFIPVWRQDKISRFIIAIFETKKLVGNIIQEFANYNLVIAEKDKIIYESYTPEKDSAYGRQWQKQTTFSLQQTEDLTLSVWPKEELLKQNHTPVTELILIAGLLGSLVFSFTVYLIQLVWLKAKELKRTNYYLNKEIEKRLNIETELREKNYFILNVANTTPNILYILDIHQNKYTYVNEAFDKLGYSSSEILAMTLPTYKLLLHPEDKQKWQEHLLKLVNLKEKEIIEIEYRLKDSQGEWRWLRARDRAFSRNNTGYVEQILGTAEDITLRKQAQDSLQENKLRLKTIVSTISDGLLVVDKLGKILFVNPAAEKIFGRPQAELLDHLFGFPCVEDEVTEINIINKEQKMLIAEMRVTPMNWLSQPAYLLSLRNISDRKQAEIALFESEQRLEGILNSIDDVIWSASPDNFKILFLNQAAEKVYGHPVQEFFDNNDLWIKSVHPEDRSLIDEHLETLFTIGSSETEFRVIRPDGQIRWIYGKNRLVYDSDGNTIRIDGVDMDITERKRSEEQLWRYAFYDSLTELPNRASFLQKVKYALSRNQNPSAKLFVLLFLDLDEFKLVNDSLGHSIGDRLLKAIASRLKELLKKEDIVARIGGDEFSILLENLTHSASAIETVKKIHSSLKEPFKLDNYEVFTNVSIGIALSTSNYSSPEQMLRDADTAMYRAKSLGKGSYAFFDENMRNSVLEKLQLDTDLRKALNRKEFVVYYQPIISLETGLLTGFEALIRWQHPQRGLVSPAIFISLAEETGLIVPIGKWILKEALKQLKLWNTQFSLNLTMSVNLSVQQLRQGDLIKQIDLLLQEIDLSPKFLNLEITESLLLDNVETQAFMLQELSDRHIQISIDDFGTGYSSLSYLHKFPVSTLKIDRSFIKTITSSHQTNTIIEVIIYLAQTLNMEVVAEGIETATQLETLKALSCHKAQGYFISKPLDQNDAEIFIKNYKGLF